ncbi:Sodium/glucose cotransporter [compost metagenome]
MTGAQWITFRFGEGRGSTLSHIIIVIFAVISVIGFIAYFFEGIGKFTTTILPWDLSTDMFGFHLSSEHAYALILCGITTVYTIKGGMYSVVGTEVVQFVIMTISCVVIGFIAYNSVTPEQINAVIPAGWKDLFFGWHLNLDWSNTPVPNVNNKIGQDGFEMFGLLFMMMLFKGIFSSLAGPVPSYDMQRVLSTKTAAEASKMSASTILVLYMPRYLMVAAFAVLGLVYIGPELGKMGTTIDFEKILPAAIQKFVPIGWKGLLLAGLLASFMGTFSAFVNAAPAYIVNDIYKKYINPDASQKKYIRLSYVASIVLVIIGVSAGFFTKSLNSLTLWLTSALYGGYAAANVLKWIWWRFNGYGYFWGMLGGLIASTTKLFLFPEIVDIYVFPIILLCSFIGCFLGTFLTAPEDEETVMNFYKQTRPWGFWGPIKRKVMEADPSFSPNKDFKRDVFNILVGIVWQMSQVVIPIYFILRENYHLAVWAVVFFVTTWLLKKYWYDKLDETENAKKEANVKLVDESVPVN